MQEQQPIAGRRGGAGRELGAAAARRRDDPRPGRRGDRDGVVARAAVGDDDLADHRGSGQRGQGAAAARRRRSSVGMTTEMQIMFLKCSHRRGIIGAWICRPPSSRARDAAPQATTAAASRPRSGSPFDDGWGIVDDEPAPLATTLTRRRDAHDHRPQRLAGYRLRPLDQPVSRLRARLHLLLCAAEPCLSRPVARPRFRDPHLLQAAGGGAACARSCARRAMPAGRSRSAATPTPTSRPSAGSAITRVDPRSAARFPPPGHDRHQSRR